jgi:membrane carboxypeptidase/penicillin-binding protein
VFLLTALSHSSRGGSNLTLSSLVSGEPISLSTPEGMWSPSNFEKQDIRENHHSPTIEDSVNTATTRLPETSGLRTCSKPPDWRESPVRWRLFLPCHSEVFEVTPRELAYAYTTMASNGIRHDPFALYSVTTPKEDIIIRKNSQTRKGIWLADNLSGRIRAGRCPGAGYRLRGKIAGYSTFQQQEKPEPPTATETPGLWGYTRDVVCAVWVGYDSGRDTGLTGPRRPCAFGPDSWGLFIPSPAP